MNDILDKTRDAVAVFEETLIEGNHDTITLLGAQSQAHLKELSRTIAKLMMPDDDKVETAICDVVKEVEDFETKVKMRSGFVGRVFNFRKSVSSDCQKIASYIDQVSSFFQLQQAQLVKELKLLEKLLSSVHDNKEVLQVAIDKGEEALRSRTQQNQLGALLSPTSEEKEIDIWYSRLSRRLDDLRISHTVAIQTQSQIQLLSENNLALLDRIDVVLTNVIPVWETQINTLLGIEKFEKRLKQQDIYKVARSKPKSRAVSKEFDVDRIVEINNTLKRELVETNTMEKSSTDIRDSIQIPVTLQERGQHNE